MQPEIGSKVKVLGSGMSGTLTRITKSGIAWVRVKSRWGHSRHPATYKTFRYATDRVVADR